MKYVASLSGGKDSVAMVLRLMEENRPLTHVVFYDTGMEFKAVYRILDKIKPHIEEYGAEFSLLKPENDFLVDMLLRPVKPRACSNEKCPHRRETFGWDWCGKSTRWRTSGKTGAIQQYLNALNDDYTQYVGIAADEPRRIKYENNKQYPLVEWGMTEADCLRYCYEKGYHWKEGDVELYSILDRVSCWCCANKNLKELRAMRHYLPYYWGLLKGLQSRIDRPFRGDATVFDLEKRFEREDAQLNIFDLIEKEKSKSH